MDKEWEIIHLNGDVYCINRTQRSWKKLNSVVTTLWRSAFRKIDLTYKLRREGCHTPNINTGRFNNTFVNRLAFNSMYRDMYIFTITEWILARWLVGSYGLWEYGPWKWRNIFREISQEAQNKCFCKKQIHHNLPLCTLVQNFVVKPLAYGSWFHLGFEYFMKSFLWSFRV